MLSRRIGCDGLSDMAIGEQKLAQALVKNAKGLVFVTVAKVGKYSRHRKYTHFLYV